jgi:hypothetical protein
MKEKMIRRKIYSTKKREEKIIITIASDTVIASSLRKGVYDPWAFYLHAALLH